MSTGAANWASAVDIDLGGTNTFDISTTVAGANQPYWSGYWTYTPTISGVLQLDTFGTTGTSPDTYLKVFTGADPGTLAAGNDDSPTSGDALSSLSLVVAAGETYHIRAGSYGSSGDTVLVINLNAAFQAFTINFSPLVDLFDIPIEAGGSNINDNFATETSVCYAGGNQVVAAVHDGYTLHTWVIDITDPLTPVYGDRQMWYSQGSSYAPDDPDGKFGALSDLNRLVSPVDGTVALIGETGNSFSSSGVAGSGNYNMIADIFTVNSDNSLTRAFFVIDTYFCYEPTIAVWNGKLVVTDSQGDGGWSPSGTNAGSAPVFVVDPATGTHTTHMIAMTDLASGAANLGPVAVDEVNGLAMIMCHPPGDFTNYAPLIMNLTTGSYTVHAAIPTLGGQNFVFASVGLPGGGFGIQYAGTVASPLATTDYMEIATNGTAGTPVSVDSSMLREVGFTGGWKSNVRSIDVWPSGDVVVGYPSAYGVVSGGVATTQILPTRTTATFHLLGHQVAALGEGFVAAVGMDSSAAPSTFQFTFSYEASTPANVVNVVSVDTEPEDCLIPLRRSLHQVQFNSGPTVTAKYDLSTGGNAWNVTFSGVAQEPWEFGQEVPVIQGFGDPNVNDPWVGGLPDLGVIDLDGAIITEKNCDPAVLAPLEDPLCPVTIAPPLPPSVGIGCFELPANWRRRQITIPASYIPLWGEVVPRFEVHARQETLRYLRLRFYADPNGDGDISDDPCAFCGDIVISYIPVGFTLVFDTSQREVYVIDSTQRRRRADSVVSSADGTPFDWPVLTCGMGYVVTLDLPQTQKPPVFDLSFFARIS